MMLGTTWRADKQMLNDVLEKASGWRMKTVAVILRELGDHVFAEKKRSAEEAHKAIVEGPAKLAGAGPMDMQAGVRPAPRFNVGDEVRTKCDGAALGHPTVARGEEGVVTHYYADRGVAVKFPDNCLGMPLLCDEDQLELVPEKPKQKFWPGDCVRADYGEREAGIVTHVETDAHGKNRVYYGGWGWDRQKTLELVAPGPNHPKEE